MKRPANLWFSVYNLNKPYLGNEDAFINPDGFEWANNLASEIDLIKSELESYLKNNRLDSYFNTSMVSKKNSWKTIALKTWGVELFKNQKSFPSTVSLINKYPQIISCSFNLLTSNSKIHSHNGDTNAIYRCHLGIDIPAGLPNCGFKVNNESRAWENNKWLIFFDAHNHEAWNNSNKDRYIFLIDVLRDEYLDKRSLVCSTVLTSLFLQKRAEKFTFLLQLKQKHINTVTNILRPFAHFAAYISNLFKIF